MPLHPGDPVLGGETTETRGATADVAAGDAVTIAGGSMSPGTDTDEFAGIARHGADNAGHGNAVVLRGAVLANVSTTDPDGAVTEGALLSLSPDAGALYRAYSTDVDGNPVYDQPGPVLALSDEGGRWHGVPGGPDRTYNVPDGYAVVYVRR